MPTAIAAVLTAQHEPFLPVHGLWYSGSGAHPVPIVNGWSGRTAARTLLRSRRRRGVMMALTDYKTLLDLPPMTGQNSIAADVGGRPMIMS